MRTELIFSELRNSELLDPKNFGMIGFPDFRFLKKKTTDFGLRTGTLYLHFRANRAPLSRLYYVAVYNVKWR